MKEQINDTKGRRINFTAKPKEIVTLKIVLQRRGLIDQKTLHPKHSIIRPDHFKEKEDFSAYRSMPVVTNEDISKENQRIGVIAEKLKELKEEQNSDKEKTEAELQIVRGDITTLKRDSLEVQLSLILAKKKFNELNPKSNRYPLKAEEIKSICREIGFKLNKARVRKRTYDYLVEYYQQKMKSYGTNQT